MDVGAVALAVTLFAVGAALAIWATDRLLDGLVGLAALTTLSTFVIAALVSGLEAENIAVGVAAGSRGSGEIALGTVFGGATFVMTVALGLGALIAPLELRLPRSFLLLLAGTPVLAGSAVIGDRTSPAVGVGLLAAFGAAMAFLIWRSRRQGFLVEAAAHEARTDRPRWLRVAGRTLLGLAGLTVGGELVADGADRIITSIGLPALLVGMVLTPAAIEIEEVFRQAIPARRGHPEVSAANLLGTLLYFVLFNLALLSLATPVAIPTGVRTLDWPFLVAVSWLATVFLARGRIGRVEGAALLLAYALYVALHVVGP